MYTIVHWQDRPEGGGPTFIANVGDDAFTVSSVDFTVSGIRVHETMIWQLGVADEVWFAPDSSDAVREFEAFLASRG